MASASFSFVKTSFLVRELFIYSAALSSVVATLFESYCLAISYVSVREFVKFDKLEVAFLPN